MNCDEESQYDYGNESMMDHNMMKHISIDDKFPVRRLDFQHHNGVLNGYRSAQQTSSGEGGKGRRDSSLEGRGHWMNLYDYSKIDMMIGKWHEEGDMNPRVK